jgi:uncharacterized protein YfdQ (DUF2303 family)
VTDLNVEAIADLAQKAVSAGVGLAQIEGFETLYRIVTPGNVTSEVVNFEKYLPRPDAKRGTVNLHDAASFMAYVDAHNDAPHTALYADVDVTKVTAVLNGHGQTTVSAVSRTAGWGDHRAVLTLRLSDNWQHWASKDGEWFGQEAFAEHLEAYLDDVRRPPAAEMLELAQTLQGTNSVTFKSQTLLANGQRQFRYEETIEARAGQIGHMEIPTEFRLGVAVFEGQLVGVEVRCRFQFRLNGGALKLRYLIDQPRAIIRDAFGVVIDEIEAALPLVAYRGTAPGILR